MESIYTCQTYTFFCLFLKLFGFTVVTWLHTNSANWMNSKEHWMIIRVVYSQHPPPKQGKSMDYSIPRERVWDMAIEQFVESQHSIQSQGIWSMWLTAKFKSSVWVESEPEAWEVSWVRSVLSHELEHSRHRKCNYNLHNYVIPFHKSFCGLNLSINHCAIEVV